MKRIRVFLFPLLAIVCSQCGKTTPESRQLTNPNCITEIYDISSELDFGKPGDSVKTNLFKPLSDSLLQVVSGLLPFLTYRNYQTLTFVCDIVNSKIKGSIIRQQVHNGTEAYIYLVSANRFNGEVQLFLLAWVVKSPQQYSRRVSKFVNDSIIVTKDIANYHGEIVYIDSLTSVYQISIDGYPIMHSKDSVRTYLK